MQMTEQQVSQRRDWWRIIASVCFLVFVATMALIVGSAPYGPREDHQMLLGIAAVSGFLALITWLRRRH